MLYEAGSPGRSARKRSYRSTSVVRLALLRAEPIQRWWSSSLAEGLFLASICKHCATKSRKAGDHCSPESVGGSALGISRSTRMGCSSACGGSPITISSAEMPSDQMSAFVLYWSCRITSGAIQNGVPTKVQHLDMVAVIWPATPKSASFTSPVRESRMLAALISRWILPCV